MSERMLLGLVNLLLEKHLDCDPEVAGRLSELEGKNLVLNLTDLKVELLVAPRKSGLAVTEYHEDMSGEVVTRIDTDVPGLLRGALGTGYQSMLEDGTLRVQGDPELACRIGSILAAVEMDWEEIAAACVGDVPAYQLGVWLRRAGRYGRRSLENFRLDVGEYLQEESRIMPTRVEMERFLSDAEELNADIDHLESRLRRLTGSD